MSTPDMYRSFLSPLDYFFAAEGRVLPGIMTLKAQNIPAPFHEILVHNKDMTPVLEQTHNAAIRVRRLKHIQLGTVYQRLIVLERKDLGTPVEFGAIAIHLEHFSAEVRAEILAEIIPLGALLRTHCIPHSSHPDVYFLATCETWMSSELKVPIGTHLYGRHNRLLTADGQTLAAVVEIVTPGPV